MKKYDIYLASAMCFIALVLYLITKISFSGGNTLLVYMNNELINEYSLLSDGIYTVEDENTVYLTFEINNGKADVTSANCKDKLCVHQKPISVSSEIICCLPNKIMLIVSDELSDNGEYDAVTK